MIEIKSISKSYDKNQIFTNQSIIFEDENVYALVGKNGIGKTTLLECIINPDIMDSGEILIDKSNSKSSNYKKKVFYVSDSNDMFLNLKGEEYLYFIASIYDVNLKEQEHIVKELSNRLKIDYLDKLISEYSLGMKQKIYLLAAFTSQAQNIILDEPFNGIDPSGVMELKKIIEDYKNEGRTVIFSSHNLDLISNFCDSIVIINKKRNLIQIENDNDLKKLNDIFISECES